MRKLINLFCSCLLGLTLAGSALAESVPLNNSHPEQYTVVEGDTLWDIAAMFLREPWRWPEIWHVNEQIANPHLIYPGDVLSLTYVDGKPRIGLQRGTLRLSPKVRATPLDTAIPVIPIDAVKGFISRPYVFEPGQLESSPYIVAFADEHIMAGAGQRFYARQIDEQQSRYDIVREGGPYLDSRSGEVLGQEAIYIGSAVLQRGGDPSTLLVSSSEQQVVVGDRLVPVEDDVALENFQPSAPAGEIDGAIISVLNGVTQIGQYDIVVIDRGTEDGLAVGNILNVLGRGEVIDDPVTADRNDTVKLPDEKAGLMMVFRTFSRVSFGLIMHASRAIHVMDRVISVD